MQWNLGLFSRRGVNYKVRHGGWTRWVIERSKEASMSRDENELVEQVSEMLMEDIDAGTDP